jgi:hypothetical protein
MRLQIQRIFGPNEEMRGITQSRPRLLGKKINSVCFAADCLVD